MGRALASLSIRAKLKVSQQGDSDEQEADRVADYIMRMGDSTYSDAGAERHALLQQRSPPREESHGKFTCEASEPQREARNLVSYEVHRASRDSSSGEIAPIDPDMEARIHSSGNGRPLPGTIRRDMESAFGADFSAVRIHDGSTDRADADRLQAKAFTHGLGIWIGTDGSANDRELMAHELTHVLQAPEAGGMIRRFSRQEHINLGDSSGATVDLGSGMVLTWGQVVGLAGDEFGSVADLQAMARENPAELRKILSSDSVHSPQYVDLAMKNISHFSGGGTSMQTWAEHHWQALRDAIESGLTGDESIWQGAQLTEAFGQHFLTDSFSAGHIRTPREAIIAWYQDAFVPRVLPTFIAQLRARVRTALVVQLIGQMNLPRAAIDAEVDAIMAGALAWFADEIRTTFQPLFGLGIAGAVSGTLHDHDNERGLWVQSDAHPAPWLAYGDNRLTCSPDSVDQATAAVKAARQELLDAKSLGRIRREQANTTAAPPQTSAGPGLVPTTINFELNSQSPDAAASEAMTRVADFMIAHRQVVVSVVGHTCPIGTEEYNDALGQRRADTVHSYLVSRGIDASRITIASAGEHALISTDPKNYSINRRVEFAYAEAGGVSTDDEWLSATQAERFPGPPYSTIDKYIPHEAPGLNDPQEEWRWGLMSDRMATEIDHWVAGEVGRYQSKLVSDPRLGPRIVPIADVDVTGRPCLTVVLIEPRPPVMDLLQQILDHPTDFLGTLFAVPAASHSSPPLPPAVDCRAPTP